MSLKKEEGGEMGKKTTGINKNNKKEITKLDMVKSQM